MGVRGKLVSQISVKAEFDVFSLFQFPYNQAKVSPQKVQSVELLGGHWGTVGSLLLWNYTQDGKKVVTKAFIEALDEKKKSVTYKAIGGDLFGFFNAFKTIIEVDTNGEDNQIKWTFEYEKKSGAIPDPHALMDYLLDFSKEIECNRMLVPN